MNSTSDLKKEKKKEGHKFLYWIWQMCVLTTCYLAVWREYHLVWGKKEKEKKRKHLRKKQTLRRASTHLVTK